MVDLLVVLVDLLVVVVVDLPWKVNLGDSPWDGCVVKSGHDILTL